MAHNDLVEGILRDYGVARRNIAGQFQIGGEIGLRDINAAAQRDPFLRAAAELFANVAPGSGEILSAGDAARIANEPLVTGASELGVISQNKGGELGLAIGGAIPFIGGAVRGVKAATKSEKLIEGILRDFSGGNKNARIDRAKQQGFNTNKVFFHGTASDIEGFKSTGKTRLGRETGDKTTGFFFSKSPDDAGLFAEAAATKGGNANIVPVYLKIKKPLISDDLNITPLTKKDVEKFKAKGFDSIIIDRKNGFGEVVIFDANQARSINATFDPEKITSTNLLD